MLGWTALRKETTWTAERVLGDSLYYRQRGNSEDRDKQKVIFQDPQGVKK